MDADFWVGPRRDPDRIRLGPPVASGAEGVLYRGYVAVEGTPVPIAVKMLQPAHLETLADWTARWREQVELLRSVRVPGLVGVRGGFVGPLPHRLGQADDATSSLYLLMDWVEGVSLDRWAASVSDVRPEELLLSLVPVAAALDLLHSGAATGGVPVVHRDVKPANILIRAGGETCLVDLGSVRGMAGDHGHSGLMGTLGYLAPEVARDGVLGPAADRYALGAVAYFLLAGHDPPVGAGVEELRAGLAAAPLLRDRPELVDHVVAMLDPDPHRRPVMLANWVAQLRRSSLVVLPGELAMPPRAPARSAGRPEPVDPRRPTSRLPAAVAVIVALATLATGLVLADRDHALEATVDAAPPAPTAPPPTATGAMALGGAVRLRGSPSRSRRDRHGMSCGRNGPGPRTTRATGPSCRPTLRCRRRRPPGRPTSVAGGPWRGTTRGSPASRPTAPDAKPVAAAWLASPRRRCRSRRRTKWRTGGPR